MGKDEDKWVDSNKGDGRGKDAVMASLLGMWGQGQGHLHPVVFFPQPYDTPNSSRIAANDWSNADMDSIDTTWATIKYAKNWIWLWDEHGCLYAMLIHMHRPMSLHSSLSRWPWNPFQKSLRTGFLRGADEELDACIFSALEGTGSCNKQSKAA